MKKFFSYIILILIILFILIDAILSTTGIETNKFNKLISNKLSAPLIFEKDLAEGICMIEDFGENKFNKVLKKSSEKT